jgi:FtsP/CotA-like multicopper oxidase with cupredoxin domain
MAAALPSSAPDLRRLEDVVNVMPLQTIAVDFTADNPGDTLFHCHQQLHMDYGFMRLFRYTS